MISARGFFRPIVTKESKKICEASLLHHLTFSVVQLSKLDARMMRNLSGMQQLEIKLEHISAHDYRSVLLPLVKSFVRVRIKLVFLCIFVAV